jgi:hypothetical protein
MKTHRTDGVSLTFSFIFLAVAAWWLLAQIVDLALPAVGWFLAGGLILLGLVGVLGALLSGRAAPAPPIEEPSEPSDVPAVDSEPWSAYEPETGLLDPLTGAPYEPGTGLLGPGSGSAYEPPGRTPVDPTTRRETLDRDGPR